jgi:hypothetical protein
MSLHPVDTRTCSFCGSSAAEEFHCPDCGFEISEGDTYTTMDEIDAAMYPPRDTYPELQFVSLAAQDFVKTLDYCARRFDSILRHNWIVH